MQLRSLHILESTVPMHCWGGGEGGDGGDGGGGGGGGDGHVREQPLATQ